MSNNTSTQREVDYLIIGAGPTGLGAAYRLKELGINSFLVIEKESYAGGLATSFIDEKGFTWDIGGHVIFSHYKYYDQVLEKVLGKDGYYTHPRKSYIHLDKKFVPYPLQNNIHLYSKEAALECINQLRALNSEQVTNNFSDWILHSFGEKLCDLFMRPYNEKVWAHPLELMSYQWIGERVSQISADMVEKNLKSNIHDESWGPNNSFLFPKTGGTGKIWSEIAKAVGVDHFKYQAEVLSINSDEHQVKLKNGSTIKYKKLLSTMPLDILTERIESCSNQIRGNAKKLLRTKTHIIGLGVNGKIPEWIKDRCWFYFPEKKYPFYRLTNFSHYSPNNSPSKDSFSIMVEYNESSFQKVDDKHINRTVASLFDNELIKRDQHQIISTWHYVAPYGYPVPSVERDKITDSIIKTLDQQDIFSRGRFGAWKYEVSNMDHSFMQGVEWSEYQINNIPEKTLIIR